MSYVRPSFVSERERTHLWVDGKTIDTGAVYEDCAPCSVVMMARANSGNRRPVVANLTEAERLRMSAGYGAAGGTNIVRLANAAVTRYGMPMFRYASGFDAIWKALAVGRGGAIAGSMSVFGPAHRLSRWQPSFEGAHSVYVAREDVTGRVWWVDPLAPQGAGYEGEWVTKEELAAFFSRGIAAATIVPIAKAAA